MSDDAPAAMSAAMSAMYQDALLAHHRAPHNRRELEAPSASAARRNPVCGDEIRVQVTVVRDASGQERLDDVAFTGRGCSIATASASMMTDAVRKMGRSEALAMVEAVERMLTGDGARADAAPTHGKLTPALPELPESLTSLRGVAPFAGRHGCAMMPWLALRDALRDTLRDAPQRPAVDLHG